MSTKVRAKFLCDSVTEYNGGYKKVDFSAVYGDQGENKDFTDATPNGNLTVHIQAGAAAGEFFRPGSSYYLDFTAADD